MHTPGRPLPMVQTSRPQYSWWLHLSLKVCRYHKCQETDNIINNTWVTCVYSSVSTSFFLRIEGSDEGFSLAEPTHNWQNKTQAETNQSSFHSSVTSQREAICLEKTLWYISLPSYWPICSQTNNLNMCSLGPLAATLVPDAAESGRDFVAGPRHFVSLCYLLGHVHTRCPSRRHTESQKRDLFQSPEPHGCSHFVSCSSNRGQQGAMAWDNVRVSLPI